MALICEGCEKPIKVPKGGVMYVEWAEVRRTRQEFAEHDEHKGGLIDAATFPRPPEKAHWHLTHMTCFDDDGYGITLDRIQSPDDVMHWTSHFHRKNWLTETNWLRFSRNLLEGMNPTQVREKTVTQYLPAPLSKASQVRADVWTLTEGRCWYCGRQTNPFKDFHVDHIQPKSKGGEDGPDNYAPACAMCNVKKRDRTVEEYRKYIERLTGYEHRFWFERDDTES